MNKLLETMSSERTTDSGGQKDKDTMKILFATNCHLGYEISTKKSQGNDSFITFEEILQHAVKQDVDFILLGGNLFHDSRPPQNVLLQCTELLRKYTMGDREIRIEFLSKPEMIFPHSARKVVNYEDPNMNISMPVFSIHRSHDNPMFTSAGSMDLLGASGLINYFGKWPDSDDIVIPPMVFRKGKTYVSIYGMSNTNDQRFSKLLKAEKFTLRHPETPVEPYNILIIHQNRSKHRQDGYADENDLPGFLDLVIWGHEHECRIEAEKFGNGTAGYYHICQPGSSVATSLCESEAVQKKIGILKIHEGNASIERIKLETVRPFVFESISVRDMDIKPDFTRSQAEVICEFVEDYIERILMAKAQLQLTGHPNQPTIPLIRLRIFYSQEAELFDTMSITRKYCDRVANPRDIVIFRKERTASQDPNFDADINECFRNDDDDANWNKTVQGQIQHYFDREDNNNPLTVLSVTALNEALKRFVEASDDGAFKAVLDHQSGKSLEYIKQFDVDNENKIIEKLIEDRDERNANEEIEDEETEIRQLFETATQQITQAVSSKGKRKSSKAGTTRGGRSKRQPAVSENRSEESFSAFTPNANSSINPTMKRIHLFTSFSRDLHSDR